MYPNAGQVLCPVGCSATHLYLLGISKQAHSITLTTCLSLTSSSQLNAPTTNALQCCQVASSAHCTSAWTPPIHPLRLPSYYLTTLPSLLFFVSSLTASGIRWSKMSNVDQPSNVWWRYVFVSVFAKIQNTTDNTHCSVFFFWIQDWPKSMAEKCVRQCFVFRVISFLTHRCTQSLC